MISIRRAVVSRLLTQSRAGARRAFSASALAREVQVFDMPSMSPTMEEGGIIEWNFKQGDKFSAGDVLLEIETDKAQIAVEAGDDGILAKILVEAGAKGIAVGQPIAVTAEEGDDLAAIDYDALIKSKAGGSDSGSAAAAPSESSEAEPASQSSAAPPAPEPSKAKASKPSHGKHGSGPLPAALRLIHEHGLSVDEITGSGPYGRITKGDVLALLGRIPKSYPEKEQERFEKMEKMDLNNVQVAAPSTGAAQGEAAAAPKAPEKPKPLVTKVSIPLGSAAVAAKVASAQRTALRSALLSLKPKPSVLRDATLDFLTAPSSPPFKIKRSEVVVRRARPVSLEVALEEPPAAKASKAVEVYINTLKAELDLDTSASA